MLETNIRPEIIQEMMADYASYVLPDEVIRALVDGDYSKAIKRLEEDIMDAIDNATSYEGPCPKCYGKGCFECEYCGTEFAYQQRKQYFKEKMIEEKLS